MINEFSEIEMGLLLESILKTYGYDFRQYSEAHIKRRLRHRMSLSGLESISQLQERVMTDPGSAALLLNDLSITVTEMFRDHEFYRALREQVIPLLKTYSFIKVWHAGCSSGEEAYSMAILFKEEGLYDRTTIYATDFNQKALDHAKQGIYNTGLMKQYIANYQRAGGKEEFSDYYTSSHDMAIMDQSLKKNIVWANHNLVTDSVFAEVHLILCRNVLIYFKDTLQNQVQNLFFESLITGGILCLGSKESLRSNEIAGSYIEINKKQRIYKKKY
jgi:chemotaxis protein methyltransferase CheR